LAQQQLGPKILEQFIAQSVLMKAAEEAGIEVSEEEKSEAFARLDEQLQAQGSSLEESLKNTPVGESFLKDELVRGLHINRYLAERLPEIPQPTDAEVDAVISRIPETVHARHILIQHADTDDAEARAAKREKAEGLRTQLLEGADFAELARQHSEGPSAPRGGDLGRFHRGKMVPPFENAAFSQEVGEIGEIVETRFGFHIIQVIDHVTAGAAPRDQIVEQLRAQNRSKMVVDLVKELMTDADVEFATSVIPLVPPAFRRAE
jgi:peptidyl-prolyl cis-trans isomerase C